MAETPTPAPGVARSRAHAAWAITIAAARCVVGAYLAFLGLRFLAHGRHAFAGLGLPDGIRLALGYGEIAAGLLFAWPRTARSGAVALVVVLAFGAGLHAGLHESFGRLLVYGAVVATLGWVTRPPVERASPGT
jgi:hypothetical protein